MNSIHKRASLLLLAPLIAAMSLLTCNADSVLDFEGESASTRPAYTGPRNRSSRGVDVRCFSTFPKFKRVMQREGRATTNDQKQWHHIVAQHKDNKKKFEEYNLHCTDNLVYLHEDYHKQLNSYYSKNRSRLGDKSFRVWLKPKDFDEQYSFGIHAMEELKIPWKLPLD